MSGYVWDGAIDPTLHPSGDAPATGPSLPAEPAPHVGPVADDYAAIGAKLRELEAAKKTVQGHVLPDAPDVTLKPWWTA